MGFVSVAALALASLHVKVVVNWGNIQRCDEIFRRQKYLIIILRDRYPGEKDIYFHVKLQPSLLVGEGLLVLQGP